MIAMVPFAEKSASQVTPATAAYIAADAEFQVINRRVMSRPLGTGLRLETPESRNEFKVLLRRMNELKCAATHYYPHCGAETEGLLSTLDGKFLRPSDWYENYCPTCKAEQDELTMDN